MPESRASRPFFGSPSTAAVARAFPIALAWEDIEEGDATAETDGVTLVVDPVSLDLIDGSRVDYVEDLGGAAFKVTNPNAASGCGCGSSFSV